ncbi:MAG: hypothetical protein AAGB01_06255 [Cyanobacteria bacterium P01_F01_bin.42]
MQPLAQGFALPLVLGVLVLMTLVALISVELAHRGKINSSTRRSVSASFYVAESGVNRTLSLLKTFPELARQNLSSWPTAYTGVTECISGSKSAHQPLINASTQANPRDRWMAIDGTNADLGEFRVVDYRYSSATGEGVLRVEGRRIAESAAAASPVVNTSLASNNSVSAIRITLDANVSIAPPGSSLPFLPSLWIANPNFRPSVSEQPNNDGGWLISRQMSAGSVCPGAGGGASSLRNLTAGDVTGIANTRAVITNRANNGNPIQYAAASMPTLPPLPSANLNTISNGIVYRSGRMNEVLTFPRSGDRDESGRVYNGSGTYDRFHYWIKVSDESRCDLNQGFPLNLPDRIPNIDPDCSSIDLTVQNTRLRITNGEQVTFYLQGNLNLRNNSKLEHQSTEWDRFQVYGNRNDRYGNGRTRILSLSRGSTVNANLFLFAPEAVLAVAENGSNSNINHGVIWVKKFGAGNRVKTPGRGSNRMTLPNGTPVRSYPLSLFDRLPSEVRAFGGSARSTTGDLLNWQREQTQ